jgi:DNA-binding transcriptional LysR family regulator
MPDGISLDQLRTFLAAIDEGSFSAAGRRLGRPQSVVSQSLANLEAHLSLKLFDRRGRVPKLTEHGRALLDRARAVVSSADIFTVGAAELSGGLEPELSLVIDALFPVDVLTRAVVAFERQFPKTQLRVHVEALGAVAQLVLDGRCSFGVMGSFPTVPESLVDELLFGVEGVFVVSSQHPLANRVHRPVSTHELSEYRQLVLSDRSSMTEGRDFGVLSRSPWCFADLGTKIAFLRAGLGWGSMPLAIARSDIASGQLVPIEISDVAAIRPTEGGVPAHYVTPMRAVYRSDRRPGPAARSLIEHLRAATGDAMMAPVPHHADSDNTATEDAPTAQAVIGTSSGAQRTESSERSSSGGRAPFRRHAR